MERQQQSISVPGRALRLRVLWKRNPARVTHARKSKTRMLEQEARTLEPARACAGEGGSRQGDDGRCGRVKRRRRWARRSPVRWNRRLLSYLVHLRVNISAHRHVGIVARLHRPRDHAHHAAKAAARARKDADSEAPPLRQRHPTSCGLPGSGVGPLRTSSRGGCQRR